MSLLQNSNAVTPSGGYNVDNSCRFDEDRDTGLERTFSSTGNRKTWTVSTWVKRGTDLGSTDHGEIFNGHTSNDNAGFTTIYFYNGEVGVAGWSGGGWKWTKQLFRDPSAWYHLVFVFDTTQVTATDRCKIYVNGERVTAWATDNTLTLNGDYGIGGAWPHKIGDDNAASGTRAFSGYIAEFHYIDGTALTAASFGEEDEDTGQWKAIKYNGSYGTNGFFLEFKNGAALGTDTSGNGNDFTVTNLVATDQMIDTPQNETGGNWCTMNPIDYLGGITLSEGNLKVATASSDPESRATFMLPSTGKWYWEYLNQTATSIMMGVVVQTNVTSAYGSNRSVLYSSGAGTKYNFSSVASYGATWTTGDLMAVAFNRDANEITFYKNNVAQPTLTIGGTADERSRLIPTIMTGTGPGPGGGTVNFGQDSSFAGAKTAQNNQDANDIGDFYYAPPAGYLALCTQNLADPSIALPGEHFNTLLYTSNTNQAMSVTGAGFQPDWCWFKNRTSTNRHAIFDSVRGVYKVIASNGTYVEESRSDMLTSFDSDGWSIGADAGGYGVNYSNNTDKFASWNWKGGGAQVTNTEGSMDSYVSANPTAGFSIVKMSTTGTGGTATLGHGLSQAPELVIGKPYNAADNWRVGSDEMTNWGTIMRLDLDTAQGAHANCFASTAPTASLVTMGSDGLNNGSYQSILYCFHSVEGYSKIGKYDSNNSTTGPFVYLGFTPAYILLKCLNAADNWNIYDIKRDGYNGTGGTYQVRADSNAAGFTSAATMVDLVSNGMKIRTNDPGTNGSSRSYLYLAFAESPFKYARAR